MFLKYDDLPILQTNTILKLRINCELRIKYYKHLLITYSLFFILNTEKVYNIILNQCNTFNTISWIISF